MFDFNTQMKTLDDKELLKILTIDKDNYVEEAIAAAKKEFDRRNLPLNEIQNINSGLLSQKKLDDEKANEPLPVAIKVLTFIFPMIITFIVSGVYKSQGYDRKAQEVGKWTLLGFLFYIALSILIAQS